MLRPFVHDSDINLLLEFLERCKMSDPTGDYDHVGDILWALREPTLDLHSNLAFLESEGQVQGFCFIEDGSITFRTLPGLPVQCDEELLEWGETVLSNRFEEGKSIIFSTQAREDNLSRLRLLDRHGYKRSGRHFIVLERQTVTNPSNVSVPAGFGITDGPAEERIEDYVHMHREAWGEGSTYTSEVHRHMQHNPGYERQLNPTIISPEGEIAASCIIWLDTKNRVGEIEPLQVSPPFRGLGLARAVVLEAISRMRTRGMERALVYNSSVNEAAGRLYASCGFEPEGKVLVFQKTSHSARADRRTD